MPPSPIPMSLSWAPLSTISPDLKTRISSESLMVLRRCATVMEAPASPITLSNVAWISRSDLLSSAAVASSSSNNWGFRSKALAIQARCFWPPDNEVPFAPT
mmetsp:Transcript_16732/g.45309  ORF Transcript_16732/g.45309 Transcript_16732/m.45309 type:complete len:102 (+) Transcript_16732:2346-2651(+)